MDDVAIGIDLGTTNSCVALFQDGRVKILENKEGGRITPSFIFYTDLDEVVVGLHARQSAAGKPERGIYGVKRLVGRDFNDPFIQNNINNLPYTLEANPTNGEPLVVIRQGNNGTLKKTPQQLSATILQKLKRDAETKLGQPINKLVVTVPAYFNVKQRQVTIEAAKEAGFTVLKLLNEPTAAALSYYHERNCEEENYSLVFDLGGGTFDVAILKRTLHNIEIVSVDGDTQLGGQDFNNLLANHVREILIRDYNYDPRTDRENMRRLYNKCERGKELLSSMTQTDIILTGFVPSQNRVKITVKRKTFEELCDQLFNRTLTIVENCLTNSRLSKADIDEVILSGGSTRIPKIQEMVSAFFDGKDLNKFVNPDECVAEGAALQAAMLSTTLTQRIRTIHLTDVVPLSLGTDGLCDEMIVMIPRNTPIPTQKSETYANLESQQYLMTFKIYEGERPDVKRNRHLGTMTITDLTPAPPGHCSVIFTMVVDENGILTVKAQEKLRNNIKELQVDYTTGRMSEEEIRSALLSAEHHKEEDERFAYYVKLKEYLITYCAGVLFNLDKKKLVQRYKNIYDLCIETKAKVQIMNAGNDETKRLFDEIRAECEPIITANNFELILPPLPEHSQPGKGGAKGPKVKVYNNNNQGCSSSA